MVSRSEKVVMEEKLPIKETVMNTAIALSTIFAKNDMVPDHILFDDNYEISLLYGDITVQLGKDQYLEDKMTRAIAILPQLDRTEGDPSHGKYLQEFQDSNV